MLARSYWTRDVSIRASRAGGDVKAAMSRSMVREFQSAPPAREATPAPRTSPTLAIGFNPRLPRGRRPRRPPPSSPCAASFNPRLPRGRRLARIGEGCAVFVVSIRASRAGGDRDRRRSALLSGVSIRASRAGGDVSIPWGWHGFSRFNPRLPRGRRLLLQYDQAAPRSFNPRLPRGRRPPPTIAASWRTCFNPRLPRGRRLELCGTGGL